MQDHGAIQKELEALNSTQTARADYCKTYIAHKTKIVGDKGMKDAAKEALKSLGKAKFRPASEWKASSEDISQAEAKCYLPPKAAIWRANFVGAWCVHLPPHSRHTERWDLHGDSSVGAMKAACRFVWTQWLEDNGLATAKCPIKGLFD